MADWQRHLYLQPEWGKAEDQEMAHRELAKVIATKITALEPFGGALEKERLALAEAFEMLSRQTAVSADDIDTWMERLYDWGDTSLGGRKKACWVDTFSRCPRPLDAQQETRE
jgi:hypothetical protein